MGWLDRFALFPSIQPANTFATVRERELAHITRYREQMQRQPIIGRKDGNPQNLTGICFSGGGIRSASFNLGVIQALARCRLLRTFDFISAVSGGSFIAGWLATLILRRGMDEAEEELLTAGHDSRAIRHLRQNASYLIPSVGPFSRDTVSLLFIYVKNLGFQLLLLALSLSVVFLSLRGVTVLFSAPHGDLLSVLTAPLFALLLALTVRFSPEGWRRESPRPGRGREGRFLYPLFFVLLLLTLIKLATSLALMAKALDMQTFALLGASSYLVVGVASSLLRRGKRTTAGAFRLLYQCLGLCLAGALLGALGHRLGHEISGQTARSVSLWAPLLVASLILLAEALRQEVFCTAVEKRIETLVLMVYLCLGASLWGVLLGILTVGPPLWVWSGVAAGSVVVGLTMALSLFLVFRTRVRFPLLRSLLLLMTHVVAFFGLLSSVAWVSEIIAAALGGWSVVGGNPRADEFAQVLETHIRYLTVPGRASGLLGALGLVAIVLVVLSMRLRVNELSLNAPFRERLVRCFLEATQGRRRSGRDAFGPPGADVALSELAQLETEAKDHYAGPLLLINTTVNLGPQDTAGLGKGTSFTLSPLSCGYVTSGGQGAFRPTVTASDTAPSMSLGTAMAISGAAVSPQMGRYSTRLRAVWLTVLNLRLGWWIRNPGMPLRGKALWNHRGPGFALFHIFRELAGKGGEDSDFLYLSDGGHFENLGLLELVRRGCKLIVACDASADPECTCLELLNALQRIKLVLGIDVEMDLGEVEKRKSPVAVGEIHYPKGKAGVLVYLKANVTGGEPVFVQTASKTSPSFPHDSTADQFFSVQQMESYRELGEHIAMRSLGDTGIREHFEPHLAPPPPRKVPPALCPHCQAELRTPKAKQCYHCYLDWHDPANVFFRREDA